MLRAHLGRSEETYLDSGTFVIFETRDEVDFGFNLNYVAKVLLIEPSEWLIYCSISICLAMLPSTTIRFCNIETSDRV